MLWYKNTIQHIKKYLPSIRNASDLNSFLKQCCEQQMSCREIAAQCHVSLETIYKHCQAMHVRTQKRGGHHKPQKTYFYKNSHFTLQELCQLSPHPLTYNILYHRIEIYHWSIHRSLNTPVRSYCKKDLLTKKTDT
jgi:hypothetical protein